MQIGDQADTILDLDEVTFRRSGTLILDAVSMSVKAGEHWALLGPNGAGKSTLLGLCGALTFPSEGSVSILGKRLGTVELQALRRDIGHVDPRHLVRLPLSARDVVLTGITGTREPPLRWRATRQQNDVANEQLDAVGLSHRRASRWDTLSQGERGRVLIARALIAEPRLLLLDEPTTGLDLAAREQLLDVIDALAIRSPSLASILVTHHLEELPETTTHAVVLSHGRVVSAGVAPESITSMSISEAFDLSIEVNRAHGRWSARTRREFRHSMSA